MSTLIGNDPNFDPNAPALIRGQSPGRYRRWLLLVAALLIGFLLAVMAQSWWTRFISWWPDQEDKGVIRQAENFIPNYIQQAAVKEVMMKPAAQEPPERPPLALDEGPITPRRTREPDTGPTSATFQVNVPEQKTPGYVDGRMPHRAHGCALRPGVSTIPAVLESEIVNEIGGQAIARVTETVLDADGVGNSLIPQGSTAVGYYKAGNGTLAFNATRLEFLWTHLVLPDGSELQLSEAYGLDSAGSMGMGGEVRTRWGQLLAFAAVSTVFDAIQRSAVPDDQTLASSMQRSTSQNVGQLGEQITKQIFQWQPEIRIGAGTPLLISPKVTIRVC